MIQYVISRIFQHGWIIPVEWHFIAREIPGDPSSDNKARITLLSLRFGDECNDSHKALFFDAFSGYSSSWNFRNLEFLRKILEFRAKLLEFFGKKLEFSEKSSSVRGKCWVFATKINIKPQFLWLIPEKLYFKSFFGSILLIWWFWLT